jgi:ABC-type transporter Mla subunit MlaD
MAEGKKRGSEKIKEEAESPIEGETKKAADKGKEYSDALKEKATEFVSDAKEALEIAKETVSEIVSPENIEKVTELAEEYSAVAKEALQGLGKKSSEFAGQAEEQFANLTEDAKAELKEGSEKAKNFFQRLFGK